MPPRFSLRVVRWTGRCQRHRLFALSDPAQAGSEPQLSAPRGLIFLGAARRKIAVAPSLLAMRSLLLSINHCLKLCQRLIDDLHGSRFQFLCASGLQVQYAALAAYRRALCGCAAVHVGPAVVIARLPWQRQDAREHCVARPWGLAWRDLGLAGNLIRHHQTYANFPSVGPVKLQVTRSHI